jgi:hypothetical protein
MLDKEAKSLVERDAVVAIQLLHLKERITARRPRLFDAILASVSLRVLFEKGLLGGVAKAHGVRMEIDAPDLRSVPYHQALAFSCGNYQLIDGFVPPSYLYREPGSASPHRKQFEDQRKNSPNGFSLRALTCDEFMQSPSVAFCGRVYSRENVVKFVANKCGGAHSTHEKEVTKFEDLDRDLTLLGRSLSVGEENLNIVCSEVIGSAWFLLNSSATKLLMQRLTPTSYENVVLFPQS